MFCPFYPPMDKSSLLFAGTMSTKGDSSGAFQLKHRSGTANVFNEEVMTQAALRLGLVKPSWLSPCQPPWNEGRWFKKLLVWVCLNMNYPFLFHVFMLSQWLSFSVSSYLFCVGSHMFNKTFWESTPLLGKAMNRIWCRFQFSLNPMDFELRKDCYNNYMLLIGNSDHLLPLARARLQQGLRLCVIDVAGAEERVDALRGLGMHHEFAVQYRCTRSSFMVVPCCFTVMQLISYNWL